VSISESMRAMPSPLPSPLHSASNTCLAPLFEMVPSVMRETIAASSSGVTGDCSMVCSAAFRRRETSPISQLDTSLGC